MTVYEEGYECPICGPVKAKISWNDEENDVVACCSKCGMVLQRIIPKPFSTAAFKPLGVPGQINLTPETMPRQTHKRSDDDDVP